MSSRWDASSSMTSTKSSVRSPFSGTASGPSSTVRSGAAAGTRRVKLVPSPDALVMSVPLDGEGPGGRHASARDDVD